MSTHLPVRVPQVRVATWFVLSQCRDVGDYASNLFQLSRSKFLGCYTRPLSCTMGCHRAYQVFLNGALICYKGFFLRQKTHYTSIAPSIYVFSACIIYNAPQNNNTHKCHALHIWLLSVYISFTCLILLFSSLLILLFLMPSYCSLDHTSSVYTQLFFYLLLFNSLLKYFKLKWIAKLCAPI